MLEKIYRRQKYHTGRPLTKIEEDGKSWLRRPKLYKGVVEEEMTWEGTRSFEMKGRGLTVSVKARSYVDNTADTLTN